jgi:hypothetical protein
LLQVAGIAEVAGEPLDAEGLAVDLGESVPGVRFAIEQLDRMGLVHSIVVSEEEVARRGAVPSTLIHRALREGRVLVPT